MNQENAAGMRAVILAGGKGTRLYPFTINFPKPLVPLGNTPVLEVLLERLISYQITDVTLTLGHLAELMRAYFERRKDINDRMHLRYVEEEEPTGTAGSLALVPDLDKTFLVMNGDLLTNINFNELVQFHREKKAAITIAVHRRQVKIDLGVLDFDDSYQITGYHEKPTMDYHVSMGIYVYEPRVLQYIEKGTYLDFPTLVLRLLAAGETVVAYPTDCMWLDIGRPDDYARAQELFTNSHEEFDRI
jgi:NDP-sugar pyrophosphorylase family protein